MAKFTILINCALRLTLISNDIQVIELLIFVFCIVSVCDQNFYRRSHFIAPEDEVHTSKRWALYKNKFHIILLTPQHFLWEENITLSL